MHKRILIAGLLALVPSLSEAKTLEDLLVEKGIVTKAEASAGTNAATTKVYYNHGTRMEFPDNGFTAQINTMAQSRYTFTDNDEDSGLRNTSSFDIVRARIIVSGTALHNEFSYFIQPDFVSNGDGSSKSPELLDAYITWHACDWMDVRMGQSKVNYDRQFNVHDAKLQFPDRSVASDFFNPGRQSGVGATGNWLDGKLWATAAMYNGYSDGEGINRRGVDTNHAAALSVRWNALGNMDSYSEGDVEWSDDAAVSLGGSYLYSDSNNDLGDGALTDVDTNAISVDVNFKGWGWSAHSELYYQSIDPDVSGSEEIEPIGFYVQGGYFLNPKKLEIAARYSYVDCDDGKADGQCAGNDKLNGVSVSLNYHWWAHHLKAQLAYELLNEDTASDGSEGDDLNTNRWILQISGYL